VIEGLTDESVCPTLLRKGLRLCGAGAFACQPILSQLLTVAAVWQYGVRQDSCDWRAFGQITSLLCRAPALPRGALLPVQLSVDLRERKSDRVRQGGVRR